METRKRNIMINKAGGNAGDRSVNYRISLPAPWVKEMNITEDNRAVVMEFDGDKIIIKKTKGDDD